MAKKSRLMVSITAFGKTKEFEIRSMGDGLYLSAKKVLKVENFSTPTAKMALKETGNGLVVDDYLTGNGYGGTGRVTGWAI